MIIVQSPTINVTNLEIVSLAEAKAYLKMQTTSNDAIIQTLLDNVHRELYEMTGQRLIKAPSPQVNWIVIMDGPGTSTIDLPQWPIIANQTIIEEGEIAGADLSFNTFRTLTNADYYPNLEYGILHRLNSGFQWNWPSGPNALKITFQAGIAAADIPDDLKDAICQWVGVRWKRLDSKTWDVAQYSNESESASLREREIPAAARAVIRRHERVDMGLGLG